MGERYTWEYSSFPQSTFSVPHDLILPYYKSCSQSVVKASVQ